ncbi:type II toxin-antitoxin system CcdA family antitoxin [Magnetovibrio blakemorei]|uniref:Post-segregation antitoxin CcdA n=1 Tax=Magnetovibrio blakemorei TaxID=28181 RepID=A0A1E5Q9V0_9PROT|nr:type II toxin-antitoxin system CcdA family antitoxin [Magnetovibrio blakemorei]OEJ68499.1 post-segregation antitoxin CcdA [Magnetovibrio blakemorei]
MAIQHDHVAQRRATNITVSSDLLTTAKALKVNLSRAAESGIAQAVKKKQAEQWALDNKAALESSNAYVDQRGLPLSKYRQF